MRESDKVDMENVLQTETLANINQYDLLQNLQKERNVKGSNLVVEFSNGGTNSIEMVSQTDCKPTKAIDHILPMKRKHSFLFGMIK